MQVHSRCSSSMTSGEGFWQCPNRRRRYRYHQRLAMIVTTSSFGFVPDGYFNGTKQVLFPDEYGNLNVAEFGDAAIHDVLLEGDDLAAGGYWNGTNGIFSSTADNNPDSTREWAGSTIRLMPNSSFRGLAVNTSESIIGYA